MIYLDAASAAPIRRDILKAIQDTGDTSAQGAGVLWGYPLSTHHVGSQARALKSRAEEAILLSFGLSSSQYGVAFYSSGSEAIEVGARSLGRGKESAWQSGKTEHPFVRGLQKSLKNPSPVYQSPSFRSEIYGQNETGITSHTLSGIFSPLTNARALLLDCIASWGKVDLGNLGKEAKTPVLIPIQANKIGGLPGIAALVYPRSVGTLWSPLTGEASRSNPRPGGENLLGIASMAWLAEKLPTVIQEYQTHVKNLRDGFEARLKARVPRIRFTHEHTEHAERLPHISHFCVPAERSLDLVTRLDLKGFCVSAGSACSSGSPEPSDALLEMGWSRTDALNAIRVSLSPSNQESELNQLIDALSQLVTAPNG